MRFFVRVTVGTVVPAEVAIALIVEVEPAFEANADRGRDVGAKARASVARIVCFAPGRIERRKPDLSNIEPEFENALEADIVAHDEVFRVEGCDVVRDVREAAECLRCERAEPFEVADERVAVIVRGRKRLDIRSGRRAPVAGILVIAVPAGEADAPAGIVDVAKGGDGDAGVDEPIVLGDVDAGPGLPPFPDVAPGGAGVTAATVSGVSDRIAAARAVPRTSLGRAPLGTGERPRIHKTRRNTEDREFRAGAPWSMQI